MTEALVIDDCVAMPINDRRKHNHDINGMGVKKQMKMKMGR